MELGMNLTRSALSLIAQERVNQDVMEVPLSQDKIAIVDKADYNLVAPYNWYAEKKKRAWYARAALPRIGKRRPKIYMHRLIIGVDDPKQLVDHQNGDTLNNCRDNLRLCNSSQNNANRKPRINQMYSSYKGVTFDKMRQSRPWKASIKNKYLGNYDNSQEAAKAYNEAAYKTWLHFAQLNESLEYDLEPSFKKAMDLIENERKSQLLKWGRQHHELLEWWSILTEEYVEAAQAINAVHFDRCDLMRLTEELIQVAAVVCAMLEDQMDRGLLAI